MKGNEPAFPVNDNGLIKYGLTKREYFAAIAMQGAISSLSATTANAWGERGGIIKSSVEMADALIAELNKE